MSVIVPAWNHGQFIGETLRSILDQEVNGLELIVVDDGSVDETADVVQSLGSSVIYLIQERGGIAKARNRGVAAASGDFLAFCDDDDFWAPKKLLKQLAVFEDRPDTDVVYGHVEQFYDSSVDETFRRTHPLKGRIRPAHLCSSMLIRREAYHSVGPYDPDAELGLDIDWYMRLVDSGASIVMLDDVVYRRRIHQTNVGRVESESATRGRLIALKRGIDRRRAARVGEADDQPNPVRDDPLLSVIMPVHNGARFLSEAVASIQEQRYENLEVIIVDDGSTDSSPELIAALVEAGTVRSVRQENSGPASARNRGLEMANGELIAFLDVDDLWPTHKLSLQVGRLIDDASLDIILGRIKYDPMGGDIVPEVEFEDPQERTLFNVQLGGGVYRAHVFKRIGTFDPTLRFCEDHDWFMRARESSLKIRILAETTLIYRLHEANMTRELNGRASMLPRVLKKSIDRRRASGTHIRPLPPWSDFDERSA